jgi:hypothetical protein
MISACFNVMIYISLSSLINSLCIVNYIFLDFFFILYKFIYLLFLYIWNLSFFFAFQLDSLLFSLHNLKTKQHSHCQRELHFTKP